jgi:hypothetical protein
VINRSSLLICVSCIRVVATSAWHGNDLLEGLFGWNDW